MSDIRTMFDEAVAAYAAGDFADKQAGAAAFFAALAVQARLAGDMPLAAGALDYAARIDPRNRGYLIDRGTAAGLVEGEIAAIRWYRRALELGPDYRALSLLTEALCKTGAVEMGLTCGEQALKLRDEQARSFFNAVVPRPALQSAPFPAPPQTITLDGKRNVIAFSLWGDNPIYSDGALANVALARTVYPGWQCRIYCDDSIAPDCRQSLRESGAEVIERPRPAETDIYRGLFWRFEVANDPSVGRFLIRDCDSRLNSQEAAAVHDWCASGKSFHVMRDHPVHLALIMAGMWGGVAGLLPPIESLIALTPLDLADRYADQFLLDYMVWPMIAEQSLIHDSYYRLFGAVEFPQEGRLPRPYHVGTSHKYVGA